MTSPHETPWWLVIVVWIVCALLVMVGTGVIGTTSAFAARPSQHTMEVRSAFAVSELCGGGSWVCVRRYNPKVFYNCGADGKCWKSCYTHIERRWYLPVKHYRCSAGRAVGRYGFLTYFFEY